MAKLLFRLNQVPEEEADAVRALLEEHQIDFYETHAGAFGISIAAIWLPHEEQLDRARHLLDDFQAKHRERIRREYREALHNGDADTFWRRLWREPIKIVCLLGVIALILYLSIVPWFDAWS